MRRLIFLCLTACAAAPQALRSPTLQWQVRVDADPVSMPRTDRGGFVMQAELHVVRAPIAGEPLETSLRAIAAADGLPFRGAAPLSGIVTLTDGEAGDWTGAARAAGIDDLLVGTSPPFTVLRSASTQVSTNLADAPALLLRAAEDTVVVQFLVAQEQQQRLRVVLADRAAAARGWFLPAPNGAAAGYVLLLHRLDRADDAELASAHEASHVPTVTQPPHPLLTELRDLVATSVGVQQRRGALLALANRTREAALVDIVLSADETTLIAVSKTVTATQPEPGSDYAWQFALAVLGTVVPQMQRDDVSLGLSACLLRHFGALSKDPSGLGQLLDNSGGYEAFWDGVMRENLQALADHRVAVRMRAHDWLIARDAAVEGFDPLGPSAARRDALRARAAKQEMQENKR
ncbi:MAG: hypothetical protein H6838_16380 [Planctomycetes bacterium]|nr:hypothetical protein [Planctomycetota bacterium]MCB9887070.1 hypothetical protein [Planctomycetota bacterium]